MRRSFSASWRFALIAIPAFAGEFNKVISVGQKAPDFAGIPAVANGEDVSVSLGDIKEDVVVLVFLANHCPVVEMYEDRIIEFTKEFKDKNVKVVGFSVSQQDQDKIPAIKNYMKEHKVRLHLRIRRDPGCRQGLWCHQHAAVLCLGQRAQDQVHRRDG